MESNKPVIFGTDHIKRAIGDSNFFTLMPEFAPLKKKMEAMHINLNKGCSSCQKRRAATSLSSDFTSILTSLSDDGLTRIKQYLGVPKLLVRTVDKRSNKVEMKEV